MKKAIRTTLCIVCLLALSSALLCSCSAPALSASAAAVQTAGQQAADTDTMTSLKNTDVAEKSSGTSGNKTEDVAAPQDIAPVSAMDTISHPCGAAVMEDGSLLVTDVYNRVIWHVADGTSTIYAGSSSPDDSGQQPPGGYIDGPYAESVFRSPWAIAPFLDGWAVSDTDNHVVRLLKDGVVQTINARAAGSRTDAESGTVFEHPTGLAADDEGNLFIADTFADTIYKITSDGEILTEATGISEPMGMCWQDGSLYVAETGKNRVISLRDGEVTVLAGNGEPGDADGSAEEAAFSSPKGVAAGADGTIYVADTNNSAIREIRDGQVGTLYARDVRDLDAFFPMSPTGMLKVQNDLYVCDPFARTLLLMSLAS